MRQQTIEKLNAISHDAADSDVSRDTLAQIRANDTTLSKIFGTAARKKAEDFALLQEARFALSRIAVRSAENNLTEADPGFILSAFTSGQHVIRKSLKTVFPSLTDQQREEVKEALRPAGFIIMGDRIRGFAPNKTF